MDAKRREIRQPDVLLCRLGSSASRHKGEGEYNGYKVQLWTGTIGDRYLARH